MDSSKLVKRLPGALRRIANEAKSFWKSEAGRKLRSSRKAYQDAIDFKIVDELTVYFTLEGFLPYSIEVGNKGFDMKPGFLKNAIPGSTKRKFPRAVAANLRDKSPITRYRIIPLNPNHYVNMQKPKVFRTVHDQSPGDSWQHPGWQQGVNIASSVVDELHKNIIPKHIKPLLKETL
jgi:hypothetical protein